MIVIGMTGPISHGKTTFANAIMDLEPHTIHLESSLVIARVANAMHVAMRQIPDPHDIDSLNKWLHSLPSILQETVHTSCTFDQIKIEPEIVKQHPIEYQKLIMHVENLHRDPGLTKQAITLENKETYRPFLQWLGGYLVKKVDPNIWFREVIRMIHDAETTGCEVCIVGGLRFPSDGASIKDAGGIIIKVYRPGHLQSDMLDPTERERDNIETDCTVMSNGSIEDVQKTAELILDAIKNNQLEPLYQTARISSRA
jgi:hypothetical protein